MASVTREPSLETTFSFPKFFMRAVGLTGDSDGNSFPLQVMKANLAEYRWDTDQAVEKGLIERFKASLKTIPTRAREVFLPQSERENNVWAKECNYRIYDFCETDQDNATTPRRNPIGLIRPKGVKSITEYNKELNIDGYYRSGQIRGLEHDEAIRFSERIDDNFVRINHAYNHYYVNFLEALNIVDDGERASVIQSLGDGVFNEKEFGFAAAGLDSIQTIAPHDNPTQWMVFSALNTLVSPEPGINGIARYRALELLSHFKPSEIEFAFFGERDAGALERRGRSSPVQEWQKEFQSKLMRLPPKFRREVDRKELIHTRWWQNPKVKEIFNLHEDLPLGNVKIDTATVSARLTEQYPREAVQVELLILSGLGSDNRHARQALHTLIAFCKTDPSTRLKIFGPNATYQKISTAPGSEQELTSEALGITVYDEDLAADFEGLDQEEMKQLLRRMQRVQAEMFDRLARQSEMAASSYFNTATKVDIDRVDPKGYWQLLGVHPGTDPADLEEVLKAAYWKLAQKYHPEGKEPDEEKMKKLNEAHGVLSDQEKRSQYGL